MEKDKNAYNDEPVIEADEIICNCQEECESCDCSDQKESSCCFKGSFGKIFFGVLVFLLGAFYLGKNFELWNFELSWVMIWPAIIIMLGISIMGGQRTLRWVVGAFFFLAAIILMLSLVQTSEIEVTEEEERIINVVDMEDGDHYTKDILDDERTNFFRGDYSKEEAESKIGDILDLVYQDIEGDDKIELFVTIEGRE
jgi:uncharacterized integral membrane protein